MFEKVLEAFHRAMQDWNMMQQTIGDEGAEWAEAFETHFYQFIDKFETWYKNLSDKPKTLEEAEKLKEVKEIRQQLPAPLQLNFEMELDRVVDGLEQYWFD